MKTAIAFIAGLIIASGTVYFLLNGRSSQPVAVQVAQASPPAPIVVENPTPEPPAQEPLPNLVSRKPIPEKRPQAVQVHYREPVENWNIVTQRLPEEPVPPITSPPPILMPEPELKSLLQDRVITPPPPPVERRPNTVTVTANTSIAVRLSETVSSDKQQAGDSFSATLDQPLVVDGLVVAERGSRAEGRVVSAERAGRVRGTSHLELELTKLDTADGQHLTIRTNTFQREGETSKKEDAARIGLGAALGAAIGGMAGGGKGAGIGAGAGGAAGAGTVMATRGKAVVLPIETRVTFRLSLPITVTEQLP